MAPTDVTLLGSKTISQNITPAESNDKTNSAHIGITLAGNSDSCSGVSFNQDAKENGTAGKVTKDGLYKQFSPILAEYSIEYDISIILKLFPFLKSEKELLNLPKEALKNTEETLKAALRKHSANLQEGQNINIDDVISTTLEYKTAKAFGWDIEQFEKARDTYTIKDKKGDEHLMTMEGAIKMHLKKQGKDIDLENASQEEIQKYVEEYLQDKFKEYLKKTKGDKDAATRLQLQNLGMLLANTPDNKKDMFRFAIKAFIDKVEPLKAFLESFRDPSKAAEFADKLNAADILAAKKESVHIILTYMSENGCENMMHCSKEALREFMETHGDEWANVIKKIQNQEELTEEEQALKDKFDSITGVSTGIADNRNLSKDKKIEFLSELNNAQQQYPSYRYYLESIVNYVNDPNSILNIAIEEFQQIMNAATNGNYDVVMNDILRGDGVLTELNVEPVQPRSGGEEGASAYNSETGMLNVPDGDPYAAVENLAQQLNQLYTPSLENTLPKLVGQENHTASTSSKPSIISSFKEWQAYYAGNTTKALKNIVSNDVVVTSQAVVNKVIEEYKNFDKTLQSNILAAANGDWFGKLLNNTKVSALKGIFASGGFIGGIYRIQQANDRIKEEEEKQQANC